MVGSAVHRVRVHDRVALLLVALLWGGNFVASKAALSSFTVWELRSLAFGSAAVVLTALAYATRASIVRLDAKNVAHLVVAGAFGIGGFGVFSALAMTHTSAGRTSIVVYTMPVWVVLLSWLVFRERPTRSRVLAVALAALGLLILGWPVFSDGGWLGPAFALLSALSWAVGTVYVKRLGLDVAPVVSTAIQLISATLLSLLGLALDPRDTPISISTGALLGIAYNTVFGTIVAYLVWFSVLRRIPAATASLGTLLVPVFGIVIAGVVLAEVPSVTDLIGLCLIGGAAAAALVTAPGGGSTRGDPRST